MIPQWIIEKKRDGHKLTSGEIRAFINGFTSGEIPDYQMAALAMAIYFKGMDPEEIAVLTDAMMRSGDCVDTSSITRPCIDKHSTGGIGDKTSLILGPLAACAGLAVPMISGRGLGITGGTLDKLESIPGFRADLSESEFINVVQACGCSIIGQTARLAPADKKLYALRDVTATVPSIPLITASIMSKKMAEGLEGLVLDVKCGKGAFMKTRQEAETLALSMVRVGHAMGKKVTALLTRMDEPIGCAAGNAPEVQESIATLKGQGPRDLMNLTLALTAEMLMLAGKYQDAAPALQELKGHIASGAALNKFAEMVRLQHGDPDLVTHPEKLTAQAATLEIKADQAGFIQFVDAETIGRAVLMLGAGRIRTEDKVDPVAGLSNLWKTGQRIEKGQSLGLMTATDARKLPEAAKLAREAFTIGSHAMQAKPLIMKTIRE